MELKLSEVLINNEEFRIDSEFFKKEILDYEKKIVNFSYLNDIGKFLIGPFGSTVTTDNYVEEQ